MNITSFFTEHAVHVMGVDPVTKETREYRVTRNGIQRMMSGCRMNLGERERSEVEQALNEASDRMLQGGFEITQDGGKPVTLMDLVGREASGAIPLPD